MNRYLCIPVVVNRVHWDVAKAGKGFIVEAPNEADAATIAKHEKPLQEGETMAVMFIGRILTGNAGNGMPVGQGGGSKKIEAADVQS